MSYLPDIQIVFYAQCVGCWIYWQDPLQKRKESLRP